MLDPMPPKLFRTIKVCPGIGDSIWLLMKLINSGEKFHFQLPDGKPQRGAQIFDILPQVAKSASYVKMKTSTVEDLNIQRRHRKWVDIKVKEFYLSANKHLEAGKRIEDFLPDLPTAFRIDWDTARYSEQADFIIDGRKVIGLYGSSYSTARKWNAWEADKWLELAKMIHAHNPEYVFAVIGAEWDLDLGRELLEMLDKEGLKKINLIGQDLGLVVEVMKRLEYFFSFPSGLGILAPTVSCKTTMFYPKHLELMMNAWASKEDIGSGDYKGCQFCEPKAIFEWVVANNRI